MVFGFAKEVDSNENPLPRMRSEPCTYGTHVYEEERKVSKMLVGPGTPPTPGLPAKPNCQRFVFYILPVGGKVVEEAVELDLLPSSTDDHYGYWRRVADALESWAKQFGPYSHKGWKFHATYTATGERKPEHVWGL